MRNNTRQKYVYGPDFVARRFTDRVLLGQSCYPVRKSIPRDSNLIYSELLDCKNRKLDPSYINILIESECDAQQIDSADLNRVDVCSKEIRNIKRFFENDHWNQELYYYYNNRFMYLITFRGIDSGCPVRMMPINEDCFYDVIY